MSSVLFHYDHFFSCYVAGGINYPALVDAGWQVLDGDRSGVACEGVAAHEAAGDIEDAGGGFICGGVLDGEGVGGGVG
jgi:hypothetical protein